MAKQIEVKLNSAGVKELLKSREILSVCKESAKQVQSNYKGHSKITEHVGKTRVNVSVSAPMSEASKNNDLLKAVHP